jgi:hypothetical protein
MVLASMKLPFLTLKILASKPIIIQFTVISLFLQEYIQHLTQE